MKNTDNFKLGQLVYLNGGSQALTIVGIEYEYLPTKRTKKVTIVSMDANKRPFVLSVPPEAIQE